MYLVFMKKFLQVIKCWCWCKKWVSCSFPISNLHLSCFPFISSASPGLGSGCSSCCGGGGCGTCGGSNGWAGVGTTGDEAKQATFSSACGCAGLARALRGARRLGNEAAEVAIIGSTVDVRTADPNFEISSQGCWSQTAEEDKASKELHAGKLISKCLIRDCFIPTRI